MASRKSVGGGGPAKAAVQVFCRIRPTNKKELEIGYTCVKYGEQNIEVKTEDSENKFNFDAIFGMDSTQEFVFTNIAGPLIHDVLSGYNATILAYGQSGTGKVSHNIHMFILFYCIVCASAATLATFHYWWLA